MQLFCYMHAKALTFSSVRDKCVCVCVHTIQPMRSHGCLTKGAQVIPSDCIPDVLGCIHACIYRSLLVITLPKMHLHAKCKLRRIDDVMTLVSVRNPSHQTQCCYSR